MAENNRNDEYEGLGTKFINGIKSNIGFILTLLIAVSFISTGIIQISVLEQDLISLICSSILCFFVGWLIKSMLGKQGIINGMKVKKVEDVQESYNTKCEENSSKSEYYPPFCEIINEQKVKAYTSTILTGVNLKYSSFIQGEYDNTKTYKNFKGQDIKFTLKQKIALMKARNPRVINITPDYLTNEITYDAIHEKREETSGKFELRRNVTTFFSSIIIGITFGYFGVSLIQNPSVANIIWTTIQILIYVSMGFIEFLRRYLWCQNEHVSYIKKRIKYLDEFSNMINNENSVLNARIKSIEERELIELEKIKKESEVMYNGD